MKRSVSVFVVALLATVVSAFGQTFDLSLSQSSLPVNRKDSIIWANVQVSNSVEVQEIIFDVSVEYINCADFDVLVIPAECWGSDGKNDPSKWTEVTAKGKNMWSFRYWIDPVINSGKYLGQSNQLRRIMSFFLKAKQIIPLTGQVKITFSSFKVNGTDNKPVAGPTSRDIIVELGTLPPPELNLRLTNAQVIRNETTNRLTMDLEYSGKAFNSFSGDLVLPVGWPKPELSPATASINEVNGKWHISLAAEMPATTNWQKILGLTFNFPATASGLAEIKLNGLTVLSASKPITTASEIVTSVDLKQPFTVKETVKFVTDPQSQPIFSLDNYKQSGAGDMIAGLMIDNTDKVVKTVSFSIEMPDYFRIESVISAFDGGFATVQQTGLINGYRKYDVQLTAKTAWPANLSTDNPKTFLLFNLKFTDLDYGDLKLKMTSIVAKDASGAVVNATKSFDYTISMKPIFSRFKKGDSDFNFGNGKVDLADLQRLADYLAGKMPNRSNYQFWSFDYNGDGLVNQKDLTDMSRDLGISGVDEEELAKLNFSITSFGELKFNHDSDLIKDLELSVYTPTGSLVYQGKLNDQSRLPESIANGPYYWRLSSQFGNVLIIR